MEISWRLPNLGVLEPSFSPLFLLGFRNCIEIFLSFQTIVLTRKRKKRKYVRITDMSLLENKKAGFKYELLEKYEGGIELFGYEVKSIRNHQGSLDGAHVIVRGGEAYLVGAHIPPYQPANTPKNYDPMRTRKILLTKKEIAELGGQESKRGLTIVPLSMYNKNSKIKVLLAVARGKKKHDKREMLKKRDDEREMGRSLKTSK